MKKNTTSIIICLTITIISVMFTGCSFDKRLEVNEGDYIPINTGFREHDYSGINLIESITIDRNNNTIEVHLKDGAIVDAIYTARHRKEWPSGCQANICSMRMEVLDLEIDEITIGHILIKNPVIVRDCPQNPERIVLRENGQIGGGGAACAGNSKCIHFKPGSPTEPLKTPVKLSEEEKDRIVQITIDSLELETFFQEESSFKTEIKWIAMLPEEHSSGFYYIEYDWQEDDNFKNIPEEAVWYPGLLLQFNETTKLKVLAAVDLNTERVVFVQENPASNGQDKPNQEPDIVGQIIDIKSSPKGDIAGRILVELEQSDGTSDKYWVGVNLDTIINDYRREIYGNIGFGNLLVNQQVQVWFAGPVRESYPAQVDARKVDIVDPD